MSSDGIIATGIGIMVFGAFIMTGLFNRLGPIETQTGMKRLGIVVIIVGVLVALTQSTPT